VSDEIEKQGKETVRCRNLWFMIGRMQPVETEEKRQRTEGHKIVE